MQFDVIIPTRGDIHNVLRILSAIDKQTLMPEYIFLIVDKHFASAEEFETFVTQACGKFTEKLTNKIQPISNITHDFVAGKGASYVRNYGLNLTKSEYVYLIDDDNTFDEKFFAHTIDEYALVHQKWEVLYSPTIMWRDTDRIQSVGIRTFHYWLGWAEPMKGGWKTKLLGAIAGPFMRKAHSDTYFYYPEMIGGNSLFGKISVFKDLLFDERMKFIYEDLDLTHRWFRTKGPIVVSKNNVIHHMERDKTKLEQSFIATSEGVYEKTKNLSLFVANNATFRQRFWFVMSGVRYATLRFTVAILLHGKEKGKLIRALVKGVNEGAKGFGKRK